jgi:hypothetical protein
MLDMYSTLRLGYGLMSTLRFDYRHALALDGEFEPPSDPSKRKQTLSRLVWAAYENLEKGQGNNFYPEWAPVRVWVTPPSPHIGVCKELNLAVYPSGIDGDLFDKFSLRIPELTISATDRRTISVNGTCFVVDPPEENAKSAKEIARIAQSFFAQFSGYEPNDDGFWVPPTAESASASAE